MAKTDKAKSELLEAMEKQAFDLLAGAKVLSVEDLEKALSQQFATELGKFKRKLERNRTEGQNLIDWVKAHLTQHEDVVKVGQRYCWLPCLGVVRGEAIVSLSDVRQVLEAM